MKTRIFLGFIALLLLGSGCDDAVIDPFENEEKYFTIYGYLDELERNHQVRVIPVTRRVNSVTEPDTPDALLDAEVRSIDLTTGQVTKWRHTLEELDDGTYAHIFKASFLISPAGRYRLEVERSDGKITYAETQVPNINKTNLLQFAPMYVSPDSSEIYLDMYIPEIPSPWEIQAIYLWEAERLRKRAYVPYGRPGSKTADGGWDLRMNISDDQKWVKEDARVLIEGSEDNDRMLYLTSLGIQIRILSENWDPPEGTFDPNILANPSVNTNVVNGYGLWGSVGLYIEEWNACELSAMLGYGDVLPAMANGGCDNPGN